MHKHLYLGRLRMIHCHCSYQEQVLNFNVFLLVVQTSYIKWFPGRRLDDTRWKSTIIWPKSFINFKTHPFYDTRDRQKMSTNQIKTAWISACMDSEIHYHCQQYYKRVILLQLTFTLAIACNLQNYLISFYIKLSLNLILHSF